jgi:hypothetical protein
MKDLYAWSMPVEEIWKGNEKENKGTPIPPIHQPDELCLNRFQTTSACYVNNWNM